ncbi:MAG TPA: hypothetical protein VMF06_05670, partial [Candidatus Limnocylindria bacterium]|nr:hypothetical protein [Candidatus Limnocylindria bacterium]
MNPTSPFSRPVVLRLSVWAFLLGLLFSLQRGRADVVADIQSLTVTNYTGYVIASDFDSSGPQYNRYAIAAQASILYSYSAKGSTNNAYDYQLHFTLIDSNGVAQPLIVSGSTNTQVVVDNNGIVRNPPKGIFINVPVKTVARLRPAGPLDPFGTYRVKVVLWRVPSGSIGRPSLTGEEFTDVALRYLGFFSRNPVDVAVNVIGELQSESVIRKFLIAPSPTQHTFQVNVGSRLYRYDAWSIVPVVGNVTVRFSLVLRDAATLASIPLAQSVFDVVKAVPTVVGASGPDAAPTPEVFDSIDTLNFAPAAGTQLDVANKTYFLEVTLSHIEVAGQPAVVGNGMASPPARYMQFDGKLLFGDIATTFTHVSNSPLPGAIGTNLVDTIIAVDAQSGFVNGLPDHTYGDNTPLSVQLLSNGDAVFTSGSVNLQFALPDRDIDGKIVFFRTKVTLSPTGGVGDLVAIFPTGFGWSADPTNRLLFDGAVFSGVKMTQQLRPAVDPTVTAPVDLYGAEETKPLWIVFKDVTWVVAQNLFKLGAPGGVKYVRGDEYATLEGLPVGANLKNRRDNSRYYEFVNGVSSVVNVRADNKGTALLSAKLTFDNGKFRPHFPRSTQIAWSSGAKQTITDDQIDPSQSGMDGVDPVTLDYTRDCTAQGCGGGIGSEDITIKPDGQHLDFTPDGGLVGAADMDTPVPLHWGWIPSVNRYAQRTTNVFTRADYAMSGVFVRGDQNTLTDEDGASVILYTGFRPDDLTKGERPGQAPYADGFGDYAGLNFRVTAGTMFGESVLAGKDTGPYPLTGRCKYYIRPGGVSGIHEAVFGQFPKNIDLYGYKFTFSNFGLSFLDSQNKDSRTDGSVYVPYPSDFTQNFDNLKFSCLGAPGPAEIPPGEGNLSKLLSYWNGDFVVHAIAFDRKADQQCDPGKGVLTLGVHAYAQHVADHIAGVLGFFPDGSLITLGDCKQPTGPLDPPFDSRLKLPNHFTLRGPGQQKYSATPVNDAYFNTWAANKTGQGFINIAAKLDAPFFEDLKVHIHTSAAKDDTNAAVYLMGGWPDKGFGDASHNFFTENPYDIDNRGFPTTAGITVDKYRNGLDAPDDHYRVRAQRTWIEVVHFDYPLRWSSSSRAFTSFQSVKDSLVVVQVEHQVKYMDAENAELKFGAQFDLVPSANLVNLAVGQLSGLENKFTGIIETGVIDAGMKSLNQLIDADLHKLFSAALDATVDPVIDQMYNQLQANYNHATKQFTSPPANIITQFTTGPGASTILNKIQQVGATTGNVAGLAKEIADRLDQAIGALDEIKSLIGSGGDRGKIAELVQTLAETAGPIFSGSDFAKQIDDFFNDVGPTLNDISSGLGELETALTTARDAARSGQGVAQELKTKLSAATATFTQVANQTQTAFNTIFAGFKPGLDDPFNQVSADQLKAKLRQALEDKLFGSGIADIVHHTLQQQFYDLNASIREGMDTTFQQVNGAVRNLLAQTLTGLSDEFTNFDDGGGGGIPSGLAAAGRMDGYAHIVGDSLNELRIDIHAKLKVPDEMTLDAYLRIRELNSKNTPAGCLPNGKDATEVTIGAKDVNLNWIVSDMKANVEAKFTFANAPVVPVGMSAGFELTGPLDFQTFTINSLGAMMGFGLTENFFSGECEVEFNGYKGKGGIFFGKTCSLDPFFWDKDVASVLGTPPFTGAYCYGEIWVPISEAL